MTDHTQQLEEILDEILLLCFAAGPSMTEPQRKEVKDDLIRWAKDYAREAEKAKDGAYEERNFLAAALAKIYPSYTYLDPSEPDWPILYVDLPTGQVSWHVPFNFWEKYLGKLNVVGANPWDGHTTEEKYERLQALAPKEGDSNEQ